MNFRYLSFLLILGAGWGLTHPLSKIAVEGGHPPFLMMFWQVALVTLVLGAVTIQRSRLPLWTAEAWRFYIAVAILGTVVPNATFYISISRLPSGVMSILISMVPLISFPIAMLAGTDRFSVVRLMGLTLGLMGVVLIAGPGGGLPPGAAAALPLAMIGPLFYALEANYVARKGTAGMDAVQAMTGASLVALPICLLLVLVTGQWALPPMPPGRPEWALVASSMIHAVLYTGYVWLAARAGAVFASQSSYLTTATGILWAMLLLGERFSLSVWVALVVMLFGVALVQPRPSVAPAT